MIKKSTILIGIAALVMLSGVVFAEGPRVEVGFSIGNTFSEGISGDNFLAPNGNVYNEAHPKSSISWGFEGGYYLTPNWEVGFLFHRQQSTLQVKGTATTDVGDMNVDNYHALAYYNFGESDAPMRPYIIGGLGATNYSSVSFTSIAGAARTVDGVTKFSGTIGAGVKFYPASAFGVHVDARWTPTFIKAEHAGWWCDPYWGCYGVNDSQYSNQFEMGGGINFRF